MKPSLEFLRTKLFNLLEYHDISMSMCECRDYSQEELNTLISWYQIKLYNANIRSNSWYRTSF